MLQYQKSYLVFVLVLVESSLGALFFRWAHGHLVDLGGVVAVLSGAADGDELAAAHAARAEHVLLRRVLLARLRITAVSRVHQRERCS